MEAPLATPHDTLFRSIFREPHEAAGLVASALPAAAAAALDWAAMARVEGSFVDPDLSECHSDLVFEVPAAGAAEPVLVYVLLEHKSQSDVDTPFQLLRYLVRLWERWRSEHAHDRLPPVLPFVVHHGTQPWRGAARLHQRIALDALPGPLAGVLRDLLPDLGFVLDDLAAQSEETLERRTMSALARLGALFLQHARGATPEQVEAALGRWQRLLAAVLRRRAQSGLMLLWSYLFQTTEADPKQVFARVSGTLRGRLEEDAMSTAERLRNEGRAEGRNEGRAEGRAEGRNEGRNEGRAEIVLRQLTRRFGTPSPDTLARVRTADDAQLDRWADAVLSAASLDEVLRA